jgi:hypothetical protein
VAYDSSPTRCFECGKRFVETQYDRGVPLCSGSSFFSEDENGNGYCKDCTVSKYGTKENFQDHLEERAYGLVGLAVRKDEKVDTRRSR